MASESIVPTIIKGKEAMVFCIYKHHTRKIMKNNLKRIVAIGGIFIIMIGICACGSENATKEDAAEQSEEASEEVISEKKLGTDISIADLDESNTGDEITFTGVFWTIADYKYNYLLIYKEQRDGKVMAGNMYLKDGTADKLLEKLDDASYEDEIYVKVTGTLDKIDLVQIDNDISYNYNFTANEVEFVDNNSEDARNAKGNYYYSGDKISMNNGVTFVISETGIYSDDVNSYVYVQIDIDNQSNGSIWVDNDEQNFYGDDYALETAYPFDENYANLAGGLSIDEGRKGVGRFYALCNNYDELTNIEMQYGDYVIVVKDEKNMIENQSNDFQNNESIPITYGSYSSENGSVEIGFYTDEPQQDYIVINADSGNGDSVYFEGVLESAEGGYYTSYSADTNTTISVSIRTDSIFVDVMSTDVEDMYGLSYEYLLDEALDFNEVG